MSEKLISTDTATEAVDLDRRSALSRLGLAVSVAYTAPVLMTLGQSAHASDGSGGGSGGSGASGGGGSGASGPSDGASGSSGPSGTSGPSHNEEASIPVS